MNMDLPDHDNAMRWKKTFCRLPLYVRCIIMVGVLALFMRLTQREHRPSPSSVVGDVEISGNTGKTQVSINSPGSQQTINEKRIIKREVKTKKELIDGIHVLTLTFQQTNGIWDSGTMFWIQLQLTGPYISYEFTSGIANALTEVRTTESGGNSEAAQKGWIELKTATPPLNEPIVLEIKSENEIDVKKISLTPIEF